MPISEGYSAEADEHNLDTARASKRDLPRQDSEQDTIVASNENNTDLLSSRHLETIDSRPDTKLGVRAASLDRTPVLAMDSHLGNPTYYESSQIRSQMDTNDFDAGSFEAGVPTATTQDRLSGAFVSHENLPNTDYLSEDGTSLSDPRSSEAETEHMLSDLEDDSISAVAVEDDLNANPGEQESEDENDVDSLEAPEDLDNLSDIESDEEDPTGVDDMEQDMVSRSLDDIDLAEGVVEEQENITAKSRSLSPTSEEDAEPDSRDVMISLDVDATNGSQAQEPQEPLSPPRKRKRSTETSPIATKRLAPRKVQAELDSDEEDESIAPKHALLSAITGQRDGLVGLQDAQVDTPGDQSVLSKDLVESPRIDDPTEDNEDEVIEEEEEVEEEVQDDTEREERNRHRQAAMDALRNIEVEFAHLRSKLYEERMNQIEREIALANQGEHPLLVEKALQNQSRHSGRLSRAEVLRDRRRAEAENVFKAHKFIAHSQFAQDKQKLRATLLSRTSAEWFQIHREKRVLDMAVPEYGYLVPDRKSIQLKNRRDLEAEITNLAALKKLIGFPAAPGISVASAKDIDSDLADMGISKIQGTAVREQQRIAHTTLSSQLGHSQPSHTHTHQNQTISHHKSHQHRKKNQEPKILSSAPGEANGTIPSQQVKTVSPPAANNQPFSNHSYPHDLGRNSSSFSTVYNSGPNHEQDRKPPMYNATTDTAAKSRDHDRDLPFPATGLSHIQSNSFSQSQPAGGSAQFQKQAQNLPNILRQDTPDRNKQLPTLSQLTKSGLPLSHDTLGSGGSHGKSFTSQFWNSKMTDANRQPAPAVSSNSAFNATLSQPGISAAYIPPKTYSPAAQTQNSVFKSGTSLQSMNQLNTPNKNYPPSQHFNTHVSGGKEGNADTAQLYKPQHHVSSENHRSLFGPAPTPSVKQEQQQHQE